MSVHSAIFKSLSSFYNDFKTPSEQGYCLLDGAPRLISICIKYSLRLSPAIETTFTEQCETQMD